MSATYARGRQIGSTSGGGLLIAAISVLCGILVLGGLYYATGTSQRHKMALAGGQCEPNLSPSGLPCTTVNTLKSDYRKMLNPDLQQLSTDVADYTDNEGNNLAAAEAALSAEVREADALNASFARFPFPPVVAPKVTVLMQAIQARVKLTAQQARSSSLAQLQSFNAQIDVASATVQTDLTAVGKAMEKPPTVDQEP
jgi:hypothetical protein